VPIALTEEQRAAADAVRSWAARLQPVAVTRAQESGSAGWRQLWPGLAELGLFAIAVPTDAGGLGGSITDLAAVLEACAGALVPGPVHSTALAGVLAGDTGSPLAERIAAGEITVGLALTGSLSAGESERPVVSGTLRNVVGADADLLLVPVGERWCLLDTDAVGVKLSDQVAADFSRSVADVHLTDVAVREVLPGVTTERVLDLAAVLAAAEAAGVAGWCLRTAVDYAKLREQFGKPIGGFQAIKHLCAGMLCRVEQAVVVAWDAAEAAHDESQRPVASAVAAAIALDAAVETAKDCIQVLGGIGFTWEHDAHLYLRRAVALRQLLGGSGRWRRRVAELTLGGARRDLHIDLPGADELRPAIRAEVAAVAGLGEPEQRRALADTGLLMPHWPAPYGRAAGPAEQLVIDEELAAHGVTRPDLVIAGWAIPTILRYGTPEQIERFVAPTLRGEIIWCQLFSEPGAGSDLAALRTRAERVEGGWQLTGQKVWTSVAHRAQFAICLARTDPEAPKHKGISYFLVDMTSPGIEIRPLREITGEAVFNEVFLDGVFVPDEMLVGQLNDGWKLARATLVNERIAMGGGSAIGDAVERLIDSARERGLTDDPAVLDLLGHLISDGVAGALLDVRAVLRRLDGTGGTAGAAESSVRKLVGVRHRQEVAEAGLELLGADGLVAGEQLHDFLLTRCLSIAGGTTQILLGVAAERILGLPRD
jgi:alkylation response protein AidB-like acyl-CoA dehydrogenase